MVVMDEKEVVSESDEKRDERSFEEKERELARKFRKHVSGLSLLL